MNLEPIGGDTQITRYEALAAIDASGVRAEPACVLVERNRQGFHVLAVTRPEEARHHPAYGAAAEVRLDRSVILPGLVNAHAHLDLTHLGPRPFEGEGGFVGWVEMVRRERLSDEDGIRRAVELGIELALQGGTAAVGDIAGAPGGRPSLAAARALAGSGMGGVSFVEFFGIGNRRAGAMGRLVGLVEEVAGIRGTATAGLQPHAPNTVDRRVYAEAARLAAGRGLRLATHLAETVEERDFVAMGRGAQREFLERIGIWDDSVLDEVGRGAGPVEHLAGVLGIGPFVVAHVNDCDDAAMEVLARTGTSVAYCPRASAYFGAEARMGPHRYREMLAAGVNVAMGTDSIVNLPAEDVARSGISVLDEARLLHARDGADAWMLLGMMTVNGARALGLDPGAYSLRPGTIAGLVAVEVGAGAGDWAQRVMEGRAPVRGLMLGNRVIGAGIRGDRG